MLLWLSAIEFKSISGYAELDLGSLIMSIVFGSIPFVNLLFVLYFVAYTNTRVVIWTNKK